MRQAFIISALALTVYLHVSLWRQSPAEMFPEGQVPTTGKVGGAVSRLSNINASMLGDRITVSGRISEIWESAGKRAPQTLILRDDSAALEIVHWLKSPPPVEVGASIECTGTVGLYRGRLQLRLWTSKDLQVLDP
jgi:RecJ-like exonuclease